MGLESIYILTPENASENQRLLNVPPKCFSSRPGPASSAMPFHSGFALIPSTECYLPHRWSSSKTGRHPLGSSTYSFCCCSDPISSDSPSPNRHRCSVSSFFSVAILLFWTVLLHPLRALPPPYFPSICRENSVAFHLAIPPISGRHRRSQSLHYPGTISLMIPMDAPHRQS